MKINITAEKTGNEVITEVVASLASSSIAATEAEIKTQVLNKDGKWVDFDPAKIKFSYSK